MQQRGDPGSLDRRGFLRASLAGASALALGASAEGARPASAGGEPSRRHCLPDRPAPPSKSLVAVVRSAEHPSYRAAVERAIALAGGLGFVRAGESVLLKPAVNSPSRYPATTDPETVLVVAEMVREAGGEPFVADRTMLLRSTEEAFRKTGIRDAAAQAGIPCRALDDEGSVAIHHPLARHWPGSAVPIYSAVVEAHHIIHLCTPRTHALGDFTMSMKNSVGVVRNSSRPRMHLPWGLKERLAEINLVVRPSLILMDGREGFTDGGPDSGDLARTGFIAAGSDPVAIDAIGLAYLRREGANPAIGEGSVWGIPMMKRAAEIGLGVGSERAIELSGTDPENEAALRAELA
jgi:uncharacterized protein (DUF362 family)